MDNNKWDSPGFTANNENDRGTQQLPEQEAALNNTMEYDIFISLPPELQREALAKLEPLELLNLRMANKGFQSVVDSYIRSLLEKEQFKFLDENTFAEVTAAIKQYEGYNFLIFAWKNCYVLKNKEWEEFVEIDMKILKSNIQDVLKLWLLELTVTKGYTKKKTARKILRYMTWLVNQKRLYNKNSPSKLLKVVMNSTLTLEDLRKWEKGHLVWVPPTK